MSNSDYYQGEYAATHASYTHVSPSTGLKQDAPRYAYYATHTNAEIESNDKPEVKAASAQAKPASAPAAPVAHHETHETVLHGAPHLEKVTHVSPDHQHAVI
mmetsp:Transcript_6132/g.7363  ORF Transcript_6132/g.7363 Transcript_6132/m.7363 type:complete len:102 (-) Transcript_6132:592-897(-)